MMTLVFLLGTLLLAGGLAWLLATLVRRRPSRRPWLLVAGAGGIFLLLVVAEVAGPALRQPLGVKQRVGNDRLPGPELVYEAPPPLADRQPAAAPPEPPLDVRNFETGRRQAAAFEGEEYVGLSQDGEQVAIGPTSEEGFERAPSDGALVSPGQAGDFTGRQVEIVTVRGERLAGVLVEARADEILFRAQVGSGSMTYPLSLDRIEEIRVAS